jgi:hypothetical protein
MKIKQDMQVILLSLKQKKMNVRNFRRGELITFLKEDSPGRPPAAAAAAAAPEAETERTPW